MRLVFIILAILAGSACVSRHPTRPTGGVINSASGNGRVFYSNGASQREYASLAAAVIDEYYIKVGSSLGQFRSVPVEIWLEQAPLKSTTTNERFIRFSGENGNIDFVDWVLVHEFAHWHGLESDFHRNLPTALEEGLCVLVSYNLVERCRAGFVEYYENLIETARARGELPNLIALLGSSPEEWLRHPVDDEIHTMYAIGFALAASIGIEELRAATESGPVTLEEILEMAGVSPDGTGLELPPAMLEQRGSEVRFYDADGAEVGRSRVAPHAAGQIPPGSKRVWFGPIH